MLKDTETGLYQHKWINFIRDILTSVGKYNLWLAQSVQYTQGLKINISEILKGQELQRWHGNLDNSSKGLTYRIFKHTLDFEPYLKLLPTSEYLPIF